MRRAGSGYLAGSDFGPLHEPVREPGESSVPRESTTAATRETGGRGRDHAGRRQEDVKERWVMAVNYENHNIMKNWISPVFRGAVFKAAPGQIFLAQASGLEYSGSDE